LNIRNIVYYNRKEMTHFARVVCFTGKIGTGKSTSVDIVEDVFDNVVSINFADNLKHIACDLGFNEDHVYGNQIEKNTVDPYYKMSPRQFMQLFGTEIGRVASSQVFPEGTPFREHGLWLSSTAREVTELLNDGETELVCIGDGRFPNEIEWVRSIGGIVINIVRDNDLATEEEKAHASEQQELYCDFRINNNGSFVDLKRNLIEVLSNITFIPDTYNSTTLYYKYNVEEDEEVEEKPTNKNIVELTDDGYNVISVFKGVLAAITVGTFSIIVRSFY
jgi:hypothetical protein